MNKNKNIINIVTLTFIIALIFIVFINYNNIDNFYVGGVEKKKKITKRKIKKLGSKFNKWEQKDIKMEKHLESWNKIIGGAETGGVGFVDAANRAKLRKVNLGKARREREKTEKEKEKEGTKLINRRPKRMKQLKRAIFRRNSIKKLENELQNLKENAAIKQITEGRRGLNNIARKLKIDVDSINQQMKGYSYNKRRMILAGLITEQDGFADKFDIENNTITELQKKLSNEKLAKNLESIKINPINLSSISRKLRLRKQSEVQEEEPESQEEEQLRALAKVQVPKPVLRDLPVDFDFDEI